MFKYREIDDLDLSGKKVIVRADLNIPVIDGVISDLSRLEKLAPTIKKLSQRGARVVIISHFGRPNGEVNNDYSLNVVIPALKNILEQDVVFSAECIGHQAEKIVNSLAPSEVVVLENLRFYKGEEDNDSEFARRLALLGDIYINDAFSVSHRFHASIDKLPKLLINAAGPQVIEEIKNLSRLFDNKPGLVVAVIGGSKVSTKVSVLKNLIKKVDYLIIGGAMANTFLYEKGMNLGLSIYETQFNDVIGSILSKAKQENCEIILPVDLVVANNLRNPQNISTCLVDSIPNDRMALDIGEDSLSFYISILKKCKAILWNGPLGAFEFEPFGNGTTGFAKEIARLTNNGKITSIAGGGDTIAALNQASVTSEFTYASTAGGAFLEWVEGKDLPGIIALDKL